MASARRTHPRANGPGRATGQRACPPPNSKPSTVRRLIDHFLTSPFDPGSAWEQAAQLILDECDSWPEEYRSLFREKLDSLARRLGGLSPGRTPPDEVTLDVTAVEAPPVRHPGGSGDGPVPGHPRGRADPGRRVRRPRPGAARPAEDGPEK
jgi:hypothetical protein